MNYFYNIRKSFLAPFKGLKNVLLYEAQANFLIDKMLNSTVSGVSIEQYCDHQVIVSLTTYGKRLKDVAITIESIMQGSMKPNRIMLWIDESWRDKRLPIALQNQQKRGLEVCFCKDIRSYTKLVPSLKECPNDIIITIDDDVLYRYDLVERLFDTYLENPSRIVANRIHRIVLGKDGKPVSYLKWKWNDNPQDVSPLNFFTGVGGVLYPPHSLDDEVFNEEVFLDICKYADDVWFNAMALKKGTNVVKGCSYNENGLDYYFTNQEVSLHNINVSGIGSSNDIQIAKVLEKYDLYKYMQ